MLFSLAMSRIEFLLVNNSYKMIDLSLGQLFVLLEKGGHVTSQAFCENL